MRVQRYSIFAKQTTKRQKIFPFRCKMQENSKNNETTYKKTTYIAVSNCMLIFHNKTLTAFYLFLSDASIRIKFL